MSSIANIYGVQLTAEDIVARFTEEGANGGAAFRRALESSAPNYAIRLFLSSWGFNRVPGDFADAILSAAER
jgi:hypothetical protein